MIAAGGRGGCLRRLYGSVLSRIFLFRKSLVKWFLSGIEKTYIEVGVIATALGTLGGAFASVHACVLIELIVGDLNGRGRDASILSDVVHNAVVSGISAGPLHDLIVDGVVSSCFKVKIVFSASRNAYSVAFASKWIH